MTKLRVISLTAALAISGCLLGCAFSVKSQGGNKVWVKWGSSIELGQNVDKATAGDEASSTVAWENHANE